MVTLIQRGTLSITEPLVVKKDRCKFQAMIEWLQSLDCKGKQLMKLELLLKTLTDRAPAVKPFKFRLKLTNKTSGLHPQSILSTHCNRDQPTPCNSIGSNPATVVLQLPATESRSLRRMVSQMKLWLIQQGLATNLLTCTSANTTLSKWSL